jgi:hypothetical protein
MTAVPDFDAIRWPALTGWLRQDRPAYAMVETYWGYRIEGRRAPWWLVAVQAMCWLCGVVLVIAAIGIWAVPGAGTGGGFLAFKLGASIPMAGVAALLLWHSSRGRMMGIEVDLRLGEVREVLFNRAGRTAVLARWGFDAIGGVHIDRRTGRPGDADLVLRYRNTSQVLRVAKGPETVLAGLRDRLGRDLMLGRRRTAPVVVAAVAEEAVAA